MRMRIVLRVLSLVIGSRRVAMTLMEGTALKF